jgi:uncharacterized protein
MTATELRRWQKKFDAYWRKKPVVDAAHDAAHCRRVWQNCLKITKADKTKADKAVLLAAAYFHDVVNLPKDSPDRAMASTFSGKAAVRLLKKWRYPLSKAQYEHLKHVIAAHSFSAQIVPETLEARIVQDADRLDGLGAIGLARLFCNTVQMKRVLLDQDDPAAKRRPRDVKKFALDYIDVKMRPVAKVMQTTTGIRLARQRLEFTDGYLHQLLKEIAA